MFLSFVQLLLSIDPHCCDRKYHYALKISTSHIMIDRGSRYLRLRLHSSNILSEKLRRFGTLVKASNAACLFIVSWALFKLLPAITMPNKPTNPITICPNNREKNGIFITKGDVTNTSPYLPFVVTLFGVTF